MNKLIWPLLAVTVVLGGKESLAAGSAPQPNICTRSCWGATASSASSQMSALTRAIVHHTAGSEFNTSGFEASKANVRAIQSLHKNNGWGDIGYHFLVDKFGNIFEGRAGSMNSLPRGTHDAFNTNSFGFNVMGYYHPTVNNIPTAASMNALYSVIAWRMPSSWRPYGSPAGSYGNLGNAVGYVDAHRRVKSTACPGDHIFNPYMGSNMNAGAIRDQINARINGGTPPPPPPPKRAVSDFDGGGITDAAVWRASEARFYVSTPSGTWNVSWGANGDIPVANDYNGDTKADAAVYRPSTGEWFFSTPTGNWSVGWGGNAGDIPVPADYNGDGKADAAIFRPATGEWFITTPTGSWTTVWGVNGDIPVPGDYTGDGKTDAAVYRPSTGTWYFSASSGNWTVGWGGNAGDIPVPGDYNGDGRIDAAIYRPSSGAWLISTPSGNWTTYWGGTGDVPVPGDYNGDGKTDAAIFRPSLGQWQISTPSANWNVSWGVSGDAPAPLPSAIRRFFFPY